MPTYALLTTLTEKGVRTVRERPKRIKAVSKEGEAIGVKVLAQYCLLGPYDFLSIVEAPDDETMTRVVVELSSRGTVRTLTMRAMSPDILLARTKMAIVQNV